MMWDVVLSLNIIWHAVHASNHEPYFEYLFSRRNGIAYLEPLQIPIYRSDADNKTIYIINESPKLLNASSTAHDLEALRQSLNNDHLKFTSAGHKSFGGNARYSRAREFLKSNKRFRDKQLVQLQKFVKPAEEKQCSEGPTKVVGCDHCVCMGGQLYICTARQCEDKRIQRLTAFKKDTNCIESEFIRSFDRCNRCYCGGGSILCTRKKCITEADQQVSKRECNPGDKIPSPDDCNSCACNTRGFIVCTVHTCGPELHPNIKDMGCVPNTWYSITADKKCKDCYCLNGKFSFCYMDLCKSEETAVPSGAKLRLSLPGALPDNCKVLDYKKDRCSKCVCDTKQTWTCKTRIGKHCSDTKPEKWLKLKKTVANNDKWVGFNKYGNKDKKRKRKLKERERNQGRGNGDDYWKYEGEGNGNGGAGGRLSTIGYHEVEGSFGGEKEEAWAYGKGEDYLIKHGYGTFIDSYGSRWIVEGGGGKPKGGGAHTGEADGEDGTGGDASQWNAGKGTGGRRPKGEVPGRGEVGGSSGVGGGRPEEDKAGKKPGVGGSGGRPGGIRPGGGRRPGGGGGSEGVAAGRWSTSTIGYHEVEEGFGSEKEKGWAYGEGEDYIIQYGYGKFIDSDGSRWIVEGEGGGGKPKGGGAHTGEADGEDGAGGDASQWKAGKGTGGKRPKGVVPGRGEVGGRPGVGGGRPGKGKTGKKPVVGGSGGRPGGFRPGVGGRPGGGFSDGNDDESEIESFEINGFDEAGESGTKSNTGGGGGKGEWESFVDPLSKWWDSMWNQGNNKPKTNQKKKRGDWKMPPQDEIDTNIHSRPECVTGQSFTQGSAFNCQGCVCTSDNEWKCWSIKGACRGTPSGECKAGKLKKNPRSPCSVCYCSADRTSFCATDETCSYAIKPSTCESLACLEQCVSSNANFGVCQQNKCFCVQ